nr:immunoglobulin heavy chain junction region [Macaca mulatta]MOW83695.1 immunoglobulin heavy chain junction region [Macaca mulatta]
CAREGAGYSGYSYSLDVW